MKSTLKLVVVGLLVATAAHGADSARATTRTELQKIVIEEAFRADVPPALALAVARVESNFDTQKFGDDGARGVMQLSPQVADTEFGVGEDELWNPRLNIQLGINYLKKLHKQNGRIWDFAIAYYKWDDLEKVGGRYVMNREAEQYVATVKRWWDRYSKQAHGWIMGDKATWIVDETGYPRTTVVWSDPEPRRVVVRDISNRNERSHVDDFPVVKYRNVERPWARLVDIGFAERLRKARNELDDFAQTHSSRDW